MNRRQLLLGSVGLAAAGAGLAAVQPRRDTLPPFGDPLPGLPRRPDGAPTVLVIGGGLSGISAATELAERGFKVTLVERAPHLGGKVAGWTVDALGETFPIEHGFHGFFRQYANFDRLVGPAGVLPHLKPVESYPIWFGDRPAEAFGTTTKIFPFNLMGVVARSESISFSDFVAIDPGLLELLRYEPKRTNDDLDAMDFATFCRERVVNQKMCETVLLPFAETTLNRPERLSAAEAIRFFHAYFLGNPDGLGFRVATVDVGSGLVAPLRARLESLGVDVRTGVDVLRLTRDGAALTGAAVSAGTLPSPQPATVAAADVGATWTQASRADGTVAYVRRDEAGALVAMDARCTHMGCPVRPDAATGGFLCPCHQGRYDASGSVTGGPPPKPLARLDASVVDDQVVLHAPPAPAEELLRADHVVLATDARSARRLLAASGLAAADLDQTVGTLETADPYIVWRMFVDKPVRADVAPFYTVSRAGDLDALAVYSNFQEPFIGWAARTGGSVIEAHAYAVPPERMATDAELRERLWAQVVAVLPELTEAKILFDAFMVHDDFTRFAPGDRAKRPGTQTSFPNLKLAGDWVRIDAPVFLMEAAVTSGRLAANAIFADKGLEQDPISTVAKIGPLTF